MGQVFICFLSTGRSLVRFQTQTVPGENVQSLGQFQIILGWNSDSYLLWGSARMQSISCTMLPTSLPPISSSETAGRPTSAWRVKDVSQLQLPFWRLTMHWCFSLKSFMSTILDWNGKGYKIQFNLSKWVHEQFHLCLTIVKRNIYNTEYI